MANPSKRILYSLRGRPSRGIPTNPSLRNSISPPSIPSPRFHGRPPLFGNPPTRCFSSEIFPSGLSNSTSSQPPASEIWRRVFSGDAFSKPTSPSGLLSRVLSPEYNPCAQRVKNLIGNCSGGAASSGFSNSRRLISGIPSKLPSPWTPGLGGVGGNGLWCRFFSSKNLNPGKWSGSLGKSMAAKPLSLVANVASRYREAVGLQIEAFWKRNYLLLVGAAAVVLCFALWRIMFGVASTFVGLSEGMAKYGFLALASAIVAFAGLFIRARFTINPDKIYRIAMRKLNTSAGILEIMGAPLAGTDVRAYVMSGGGPKLKNFKLRLGGKRCFLIFPIRGSERRGLVSVEAKKRKGQYDIKLLAVDIPMATGPDQRLFMIGDEEEYKVGGGLISELRDPIVKAMAAEKEFEDLDQKEEEEDEERELAEEERKRREEAEMVQKENP